MKLKKAIFKVGGSILENPEYLKNTINQFSQLLKEKIINKIIIIPGGGKKANFIRELDMELNIGDTLAHWMAVYSMDTNGKEIVQKFPFIEITDDIGKLKTNESNIIVFLTLKFLKNLDPLPHSWNVTSDSISLYIANKLKFDNCYLIKDVDGIMNQDGEIIENVSTKDYNKLRNSGKIAKISLNEPKIKQSTPIDNYLIKLIDSYKVSCLLLNGASKASRIYNYFAASKLKDKIFTKISFSY
jgi:aspartokinase-like uncharacterized kinase